MKKLRTVLAVLLLLAMTLTALVSCAGGSNKKDEGGTDREESVGTYIKDYVIIRSDNGTGNVGRITSMFKNEIAEFTKADLPVRIDVDETDKSGYEILVGNTDREESKQLLETLSSKTKKQAFAIRVTERKIVIVGLSEEDLIMGVRYFSDNYVKTARKDNTVTIGIGESVIHRTGKVLYMTDDLHAVVLSRESDIYKPDVLDFTYNATYGKIIKLEHQKDAKNNGILFATHENVTGSNWDLFRSDDDGKSWVELDEIPGDEKPGLYHGYHPFLYELPEDMGKYKAGTILFAGCTFSSSETIMYVAASSDLGRTWEAVGNVDVGGVYNDGDWTSEGLWEPALAFENGRIYCFYSDEKINGTGTGHVGGHNQRLVYKYTTDLKDWSDVYECVATDEPNHRAGMISLTKMGNGKWAIVYEICGYNGLGCPILIKFADSLDGWDVADPGNLILNQNGQNMGSAPATTWTPKGGENGILFVVANGSGGSKTKCDLFMSFDYGKTFVSIDNPINTVSEGAGTRGGYSAGFYTDSEGSVYYVNNPQAYKNHKAEKLAFAKLVVY